MHDWKVLNKATLYIVANALKYRATCLVICHQDTCNTATEEVLAMIYEDISAGSSLRAFPARIYTRKHVNERGTLGDDIDVRRKSHKTEEYSSREVSSPERRHRVGT